MLRRFSHPLIPRSLSPVKNGSFTVCNEPEFPLPRTPLDDGSSPAAASYKFVKLLNACARSSSPTAGEQAHSILINLGLCTNLFVGAALVDMYCKCGRIPEAQNVFVRMPRRNVVVWNSLIRGHAQSQFPTAAFELFAEMIRSSICPSPFSISSVLVACSLLQAWAMGIMVHCISLKYRFCSNLVVGAALLDMYSKCLDISGSRRVFEEMDEQNVVTWTSLINGYALNQRVDEAMLVVKKMKHSGTRLNAVTYSTLLSAFSKCKDLAHGLQLHCLVIQEGFETHPYISSALSTMYSKCGTVEDFNQIVQIISTRDQILHNSVIAGFSHLGNAPEVLKQFVRMRQECVPIDRYTFSSLLRAIGILSALEEGRQLHGIVFKTGHASVTCVQNGLVSMYARCGEIYDSRCVFFSMNGLDLVSWNSLLSGCAQSGYGKEAVELFEQMRRLKVKPDSTTFLCVLSACSHAGFIDKGLEYFDLMNQQGDPITPPEMEHYACMVDLFGRAGYLKEAESFVNNMPVNPGASVYRSLLSACKVHGNTEMAIRAAKGLVNLCPSDSATYVLLSSVLAGKGFWDNAATLHKLMIERGIKKKAGWSRVEG